jgi:hypothetical protein
VRIDISHARGHMPAALARAEIDQIVILRCGKPYRMLVRYDHFSRWAGAGERRNFHAKILPRHRWRNVNSRYVHLHTNISKSQEENRHAA